jgi:hypothetical protein
MHEKRALREALKRSSVGLGVIYTPNHSLDPGRGGGASPSLPDQRRASPIAPRLYKCTIGMIRIATMFATLIIGLIAGPAVSL